EVQARGEAGESGLGRGVSQLVDQAKRTLTSVAGAQGSVVPPSQPSTSKNPRATDLRTPICELVSNQLPDANEAEARADAAAVAQDIIERRLAELDPPVYYRPTAHEVENEFLIRDEKTRYLEKLGKISGDEARMKRANSIRDAAEALHYKSEQIENLTYLEYYVQLSDKQVRELRTRDRLADSLRILGLILASSVAGVMFLRVDQWTRGHLTRWVAFAALALAGAAAVGLYLL
ncbi:MAG TPA: hypothetical protein VLM40_10055, partial [Gemmata sp.]|nr:hypothetical protein [Gemmata sp.]